MGLIGFNGNQDEVEEKQTQRHPIISSFAEGTDKRKLTPVEEMLFLKENRRIDEEFSNLKSCHFISRLVHPHPSSHTACAVSL